MPLCMPPEKTRPILVINASRTQTRPRPDQTQDKIENLDLVDPDIATSPQYYLIPEDNLGALIDQNRHTCRPSTHLLVCPQTETCHTIPTELNPDKAPSCGPVVRNAIRRVLNGLAGERSQLMNWPDPNPARSLSLVVG